MTRQLTRHCLCWIGKYCHMQLRPHSSLAVKSIQHMQGTVMGKNGVQFVNIFMPKQKSLAKAYSKP